MGGRDERQELDRVLNSERTRLKGRGIRVSGSKGRRIGKISTQTDQYVGTQRQWRIQEYDQDAPAEETREDDTENLRGE